MTDMLPLSEFFRISKHLEIHAGALAWVVLRLFSEEEFPRRPIVSADLVSVSEEVAMMNQTSAG